MAKPNWFRRIARKILIGSEDATALLWNSRDRINFSTRSAQELLDYNETCMYLNKGINVRAEKVSEVQFVFKDKNNEVIDKPDDPILLLLDRPNKMHTGKQFWKLVQKYLDLTGEAYILIEGEKKIFEPRNIAALYVLPSQCVTVNFDKEFREVESYTYKTATSTITYPAQQIIRLFDPDPKNPAFGISLIASGIRQIETDVQLTEHQANVLKNGGSVDGVFKYKSNLTADQVVQAEERYKEKIAGARKAGTPLFLGGDADYIRLGLTPSELSYLESKKFSLDDIATLTDVPRVLLARTSDETYANADAALAIFLREKIKPQLQNLVTALDWYLVPEDPRTLSFVDPTPANKEEMRKNLETANTVSALTTNEKREKLAELGFDIEPIEDVEDADRVLVPFSVSPLKSDADKEADRPDITPTEDPNADPNATPEDANNEGKRIMSRGTFQHPLRDKELRKKWGEVQLKRLDKRQGLFVKAMRDYFEEQQKRVLENIGGLKSVHLKTLVDRIFDKQIELKLASRFALPLLRRFLVEAGENAFNLVESKYNFQLSTGIENWLDRRTLIFADEITSTTYNKLKDQFSQSFEEGENREQLIKRIQTVYGGFDENRAKTIARTEVHGAVQKGTDEGYRQSGIPIKIWVWAAGVNGGAREEHQAIDGQEVPINQPFSNGLMYPGDPNGDPEETINCECSI